ncbi:MAG: hypothetical protein COZ06_23040 [Armatimonadetes bacterium CG_4_10_14_3_um_filter_66_18]|nr:BrnT family toxin [Armatimonadota bacterium]NDK16827.1 BrnT family toxin [Armatimonadota bacterium]PIY43358.1 MAG: hypothetical protein COZ06_23040 [Armatimonadetes bacterium CG_4_10_14_3_um_filter_66_18]
MDSQLTVLPAGLLATFGGSWYTRNHAMFDWDAGNTNKNLVHGVHDGEIEEACEDPDAIIIEQQVVDGEERYVLLGRAATSGVYLRVVYTWRTDNQGEDLMRSISAVTMGRPQRRRYQRG